MSCALSHLTTPSFMTNFTATAIFSVLVPICSGDVAASSAFALSAHRTRSGVAARDCTADVYVLGARAPMSYRVEPPTNVISRLPADLAANRAQIINLGSWMSKHVHMIHLRNLGLTMNLIARATDKEMPAQTSTRAYAGRMVMNLSTVNKFRL
jgi:hypothetical protein